MGAAAAVVALAGALVYLIGYVGVRVRYRRGGRPRVVVHTVVRDRARPRPLPEITP